MRTLAVLITLITLSILLTLLTLPSTHKEENVTVEDDRRIDLVLGGEGIGVGEGVGAEETLEVVVGCGYMHLKDREGERGLLGRSLDVVMERENVAPRQQQKGFFVMFFAEDGEAAKADLRQEQGLVRRRLLVEEGEDVGRIGRFFGCKEFGVEDGVGRQEGEREKGGGGEKEEGTVLTGG